ncbi:Unknown protein [Striga hermonthica]|uniref:Uncharacterized protein n=1 Tax=Striga hermonthica TaxID=68872 RepID=A0A9N7RMR0_STRHE|nr:Unknown protein [Striga hermonthica]
MNRKTQSKISRSLHRLIRSVFGQRSNRGDCRQNRAGDGLYSIYDRSGALSTIHESPEFDGLSPEIRSLVIRTASDRRKCLECDNLVDRCLAILIVAFRPWISRDPD